MVPQTTFGALWTPLRMHAEGPRMLTFVYDLRSRLLLPQRLVRPTVARALFARAGTAGRHPTSAAHPLLAQAGSRKRAMTRLRPMNSPKSTVTLALAPDPVVSTIRPTPN